MPLWKGWKISGHPSCFFFQADLFNSTCLWLLRLMASAILVVTLGHLHIREFQLWMVSYVSKSSVRAGFSLLPFRKFSGILGESIVYLLGQKTRLDCQTLTHSHQVVSPSHIWDYIIIIIIIITVVIIIIVCLECILTLVQLQGWAMKLLRCFCLPCKACGLVSALGFSWSRSSFLVCSTNWTGRNSPRRYNFSHWAAAS